MKWVVLSDLHLKFKTCTTEIAREKLFKKLKEENKKGKISFILITGDCLHMNEGDVDDIKEFILSIAESCDLGRDKVILCPGNHDISREIDNRNKAITKYRESGELPDIERCLEGYSNFNELYALIYQEKYQPFKIKIIGCFRIFIIDSCLLSMDDNDYGHLAVNFTKLSELSKIAEKVEEEDSNGDGNDDSINIVIMHHSVEWLQPEDGRRFQHWLADNNIRMVFCGHNHAPGMNILTEAIEINGIPRDGILQFTCGCVLSDSYSKPAFLVGEYMKKEFINMKLYEYRNNSSWEVTSGILRSFPEGIYEESTTDGLIKNSYDIPKIYDTIFDIDKDAEQDIKTSSRMDFFGLRGGTFLEGNSKIAEALYEKNEQISCRLLVSDPYSPNIEKRLRNVPEFCSQKNLEEQWRTNYVDIKKLRDNFPIISSWKLRFHEQPLLFRFIITDCYVYFGYYEREPSSKSRMYRYTNKSSIYKSLSEFFNSVWGNANTNFSSIVPDRCSFVLDKFDMKPSLVINITSECNMNCCYCPDGGENLQFYETLCDVTQIKYLLTAYADYYRKIGWVEKKVVRITGGEPLLCFDKLLEILKHAKSEDYEKVVLCTNGLLLKKCYEYDPEVWDSVKNILLLKISLDTMKKEIFTELTDTEPDKLQTILDNILFAKKKGFKIEINFVATNCNVQEIESVFNYVRRLKLVGLKVLTVNDFGGIITGDDVKVDNVETELNALIGRMRNNNYVETGLYVHNNKGIHMKRFIYDGCTLTIVDHINRKNSLTPRRTYSEACHSCGYYPDSHEVHSGENKPCATGIMSLTMRADGMLSFCRMKNNDEHDLKGKTLAEIKEMVKMQLENFKNCYHYQIEEKR